MHLPISNFTSQKVEEATRGAANWDSCLTNKEELFGKVEMIGTSGENENFILELGKGKWKAWSDVFSWLEEGKF